MNKKMPSKYECKICSRSFVHKETLDEHNYLHGRIIRDGHFFSCPVCQQEVSCHLGSHSHAESNHVRTPEKTETVIPEEAHKTRTRQDHARDCNRKSELIESAKKKNNRSKSVSGELNTSSRGKVNGNVHHCEVCDKSFVYLKCLLKHRATDHSSDAGAACNNADATVVMAPEAVKADDSSATAVQVKLNESQEQRARDDMPALVDIKAESSDSDSENDADITDADENEAADKNNISDDATISEKPPAENMSILPAGKRKSFPCLTCRKVFQYKTTLVRHWRIVHYGSMCDKSVCPICRQIFDNQAMFSKHFDGVHKKKSAAMLSALEKNPDKLDDVSFCGVTRCVLCKKWFTCQMSLLRHNGLKHRAIKCLTTGKISYKCFHCDRLFDTNLQLIYHRHNEHYLNKNSDGGHRRLLLLDPDRSNEPGDIVDSAAAVASDDETIQGSDSDSSDYVEKKGVRTRTARKLPEHFCVVCSKAFASLGYLIRHQKMKHAPRTVLPKHHQHSRSDGKQSTKHTFVCGLCSEEFDSEDALSQHIEFIHKRTYEDNHECSCPLCGLNCQNQAAFSQHYEVSHHQLSVLNSVDNTDGAVKIDMPRCASCRHWFSDRQTMLAHRCTKRQPLRQPTKTRRARYRCIECGEAFEILRRFLLHRKEKHQLAVPEIVPTDNLPQTSVVLPDSHETRLPVEGDAAVIQQPIATTEAASAPVTDQSPIPQCPRGRPRKAQSPLDKNEISRNDDNGEQESQQRQRLPRGYTTKKLPEGTKLECPECRRGFPNVTQLRKHRRVEHRNRTCQLCGEVCKSADMVYYHNLKHHHEQKCEVCGASCSGRIGLIEHYRTTHPREQAPVINRKTLICEYCPRVFAGCASRLLRDHIESCHLGRVHLCDVCGKRLGSAQTLAVHHRMHDTVARFACEQCNRRFPHNTNLVNHIRKHHPERLPAKYVREFRCEICSQQFGSSSGLTRHRSEKHGSTRHQCDLCLRVFQSAAGLRTHKRRDHPQPDPEQPVQETALEPADMQPLPTPQLNQPTSSAGLLQFSASSADSALVASFIASLPGSIVTQGNIVNQLQVNIPGLQPGSFVNIDGMGRSALVWHNPTV